MDTVTKIPLPTREDVPFGPNMTDYDVWKLYTVPEIAAIDKEKFPANNSLENILKNDTRIRRYKPGEIVVREGDYGNSAFLVLNGTLRVVLSPGLPGFLLGQKPSPKKSWWKSLSQLLTNRKISEIRDIRRYSDPEILRKEPEADHSPVFLQDFSTVLNSSHTGTLEEGALFGELAAMGRIPRTATVFSENHAELLEIRWQGLRELRKYDQNWRSLIEKRYSQSGLAAFLKKTPLFEHLQTETLQEIAANTVFKSYGTYDWAVPYKSMRDMGEKGTQREPAIIRQGDYPEDLLIVRAGFARVSTRQDGGEQTITYLGAGHAYGADELLRQWEGEKNVSFKASISALGYVDILQIPAAYLEKYVFPSQRFRHRLEKGKNETPKHGRQIENLFNQSSADKTLMEWAVQERFINGTEAMLINLDRCVRCDDCVNACAAAHDGNPRFIRHGKIFGSWMVANACMHCMDPVCMIGCPTGAITRMVADGTVVINDDTCIGCETCANSCPYSNIQMVEINDPKGNPVLDFESHKPILKATKCDLCIDHHGGPACVRACSQGALHRVDFHHAHPQGVINRWGIK
ncbi:MAG: oxidoreductase [Nitrospinaceae bacterium]|nr:MAG: oxidoreductase [Nitrospinaceae bacterium]